MIQQQIELICKQAKDARKRKEKIAHRQKEMFKVLMR